MLPQANMQHVHQICLCRVFVSDNRFVCQRAGQTIRNFHGWFRGSMIISSIPQCHSVSKTRSLRAVLTNTTHHDLGNIKSKELVIITFYLVYWYRILIYNYI